MALVAILIASAVAPTLGADAERIVEGAASWREAGCATCHGPFAQGGESLYAPKGANLRRTGLSRAALVETVRCGRPGRDMPSLLAGAYVEVACYGLPLGRPPEDLRPWGRTLTTTQIEAIADFLFARVVGNGRISRADCELFLGESGPCVSF